MVQNLSSKLLVKLLSPLRKIRELIYDQEENSVETRIKKNNFTRLIKHIEGNMYENEEKNEKLAFVSDIGQYHHENQDSGLVKQIGEWSFLGVSDGVSCSNSPKLASICALEKSYEYLKNVTLTLENAEEKVKEAIFYANTQVQKIEVKNINPKYDPPEATIIIALVKENKAFIGWVGDSRAYTLEENGTQLLTRDDSWVMVAVENGMSFEEANNSPMAHAITQCMGMENEAIRPNTLVTNLDNKDLLLCSDGLWNYFDGEKILHTLYYDTLKSSLNTAKDIGINLVKAANLEGGRDNITVAILKS